MNATNVLCPICGSLNESLDLEETCGWMECENCHTAVQIKEYTHREGILNSEAKICQVLVPLTRK